MKPADRDIESILFGIACCSGCVHVHAEFDRLKGALRTLNLVTDDGLVVEPIKGDFFIAYPQVAANLMKRGKNSAYRFYSLLGNRLSYKFKGESLRMQGYAVLR